METPDPPSETAPPASHSWTPLTRIAFRIAFLYFFCFIFLFGNGTILDFIPRANAFLNLPMALLAQWVGQHLFHLTGLAAKWQGTHSGDTPLNWILNGLFIVFALTGGLLWTIIATLCGSRRTEYQTLYAWLRFLLRLTIAMFLFTYGFAKLFPMQMPPISIAILNEPVGNMSPMTFLWSLIGLNPIYESIMGLAEVVGGILFLFRRTALLGALFASFVLVNVVLDNFFFDVPVKLFSSSLLLATLFVVLPDLNALYHFFWLRQPAAPCGVWIPRHSRRSFRIATRTIEIVFIVFFLVIAPFGVSMGWRRNQVAAHTSSPLLGAWRLDPTHPATGPFVTLEGQPATDLYLDTTVRAFTRSADGQLWRTQTFITPAAHTIEIYIGGKNATYTWQMPDPNHVTLTSLPSEKPTTPFTPDTLTFTRTPIPTHYPLLDRGFHFVNEWGLER